MRTLLRKLHCLHILRAAYVLNSPMTARLALTKPHANAARGRRRPHSESGEEPDARPSARTVLRGNSRPHAGARGGRSAQARHRPAGRCRPRLRGRQGVRDAAAARLVGARRAGAAGGYPRGEEGPARRRAGQRHRRVLEGGGACIDKRRQGAAGQEGRFLRRRDREARPRRDRRHRRNPPRGDQGLSVA